MGDDTPSVAVEVMQPGGAARATAALEVLKSAGGGEGPSRASMEAFLRRPETTLLVAWADDEPVGFLVAYRMERVDRGAPMMCLYEIGAARSHRRRGVATALLRCLGAEAGRLGVGEIWTLTHLSNAPARRLFDGTGALADPDGESVVYVWGAPDRLERPPPPSDATPP